MVKTITKFFTTESHRSYQLFFYLLIAIFISVAIILMSIGLSPILDRPWDLMMPLDGGWRILNGQIPHVDFYSPLGPFYILLAAFGMKVAPLSPFSLVYGNLLLFFLIIPWAWVIARSRLSPTNAFLFVLFMGFLLVAPRALGNGVRELTYAMLYNRQGFVLLSILLVELFIQSRLSGDANTTLLGGLSSGLLLGIILFLKINYFGIGMAAVLFRILLFRPSPRWLILFVSGFLFVCIAMQALFNVSLLAMLSNITMGIHANSSLDILKKMRQIIDKNLSDIYLSLILMIFLLIGGSKKQSKKGSFWQRIKVLIITTFVIVSGLLICSTNDQGRDIPLFFVAGLILLEYLRREFKLDSRAINSIFEKKYFLAILIVTFFCGNILVKDLVSFIYSASWNTFKSSSISESIRFDSKTLHDMVIPRWSPVYVRDYPQEINDGLTLLRRHVSSDSRVFALNYTNPFSFALELPPPHGDALWWHNTRSFNEKYFPEPEQVFQDVDMIIIPKNGYGQNSETIALLKKIYGDYVSRHFIEKDSSKFWTLLVRAC